jgi:ATP-dependent DNA helicase DinG
MSVICELLSDPSKGLIREVRPSQVKMAEAVEAVIRDGGLYCVEGPVGIGKSFAYLTPALYAGKKAVVATPTKSLQDQLMNKDLPAIARALGRPLNAVVVKGKGNYACRSLAEKQRLVDLPMLEFFQTSKYGDKADFLGDVPPHFRLATAEHCIGRSCARAQTCGFMQLKREMQTADVVVVNHHLLGSDFYFGRGKLTGGPYDVLVIDEAHKLADGLRAAYALTVAEYSARELHRILSDLPWDFPTGDLVNIWSGLFSYITDLEEGVRKPPIFVASMTTKAVRGLNLIGDAADFILKEHGVFGDPADPSFEQELDPELRHQLVTVGHAKRMLEGLVAGIDLMQGEADEAIMDNTVLYSERSETGILSFHAAPIDMAPIVRPTLQGIRSIVLTSATLAVDNSFGHLHRTIGVEPTAKDILPTVFNYRIAMLMYAPEDLEPVGRKDEGYQQYVNKLVRQCAALIRAANGNTFILCTAEDEMALLYNALLVDCPDINFFRQTRNVEPKALLKQYLAEPRSVLFGLRKFWEGVDVQGGKLRQVIIPKLPFPQRGKPMIVARQRKYEDGFQQWYNVDRVDMMIDVRQMAGRLIRSLRDRGVVAILDSRVWTRKYGPEVLDAIHAVKRTAKLSEAEKYLHALAGYFHDHEGYKESEVRL